jgi:hypothetical protein
LARLIPFLIYEAKRKKRWIWVETHSHKKLVNPILEENINPIKCGIQAKLDLTNPSIERGWLGQSFLLK